MKSIFILVCLCTVYAFLEGSIKPAHFATRLLIGNRLTDTVPSTQKLDTATRRRLNKGTDTLRKNKYDSSYRKKDTSGVKTIARIISEDPRKGPMVLSK